MLSSATINHSNIITEPNESVSNVITEPAIVTEPDIPNPKNNKLAALLGNIRKTGDSSQNQKTEESENTKIQNLSKNSI